MNKLEYKWTTVQQDHNGDWFLSPVGANRDCIITVEDQRQFLKDLTEAHKENVVMSYKGIIHWMVPESSTQQKIIKILEVCGARPSEELVEGLARALELSKFDIRSAYLPLLTCGMIEIKDGWIKKVETF